MGSSWMRRQFGRYGGGCALAVVLGGVPAVAATDVPTAVETIAPAESGAASAGDDGRRTLRRLPANLGRGLVGVFNLDNAVPLVVGGVAAGSTSLLDEDFRRAAKSQHDWGATLETAGGPVYSSIIVVGIFAGGRFAHGTRFRAMTYDMFDASIINLGYTELLKVVAARERPNGQDNKSFPSGHTSNAFAMAAVAQRHYGWKIGAPAYLLAGVVGASRLHQDKHWLSDVVAGGALGYIVGRTVVRVNGRALEHPAGAATTLNLSPIVSRHARGLRMSVTF